MGTTKLAPGWRPLGAKDKGIGPTQVQDGAFSNKSQAVPQLCLNLSLSNFPGSILVQHGATHLQFAEVSLDLRTQGGWRTDTYAVPQRPSTAAEFVYGQADEADPSGHSYARP